MKIQEKDKLFTVWESRKDVTGVVSTKNRILLGCLEIGKVQAFRVGGHSILV